MHRGKKGCAYRSYLRLSLRHGLSRHAKHNASNPEGFAVRFYMGHGLRHHALVHLGKRNWSYQFDLRLSLRHGLSRHAKHNASNPEGFAVHVYMGHDLRHDALIDGFDDFDLDSGNAFIDHVEFFGRAEGEVEDAIPNKGPAVIYFDDDGFAVAKVGDADYCAEGQFAVCGGQAVHVVDFTAGCWSSVKFVRVVRCVAYLRRSVFWRWRHGFGGFGGFGFVCDGFCAIAGVRCTSHDRDAEEDAEQVGNFIAPQVVACCRRGRICGRFHVFCNSLQCHRVSPGLREGEQRLWFRLEWRMRQ